MAMSYFLRYVIIVGLAIQLCNGTDYWKRSKQKKLVISSSGCARKTESSKFICTKNKTSDLETRLQNIGTTSAEDSSEYNDDSCEDLDSRDRQSTQKLQNFVQSRALSKKIKKKLKKITKQAFKTKVVPLIAKKIIGNASSRSVNSRFTNNNNNFQKSFQQSTTTSTNTVGMAGGNIFLSIPEGYIANTVSTTMTYLLTEQEAIRLGLLSGTSISENKMFSFYQNGANSNSLENRISRSENSNTLLVKNNANLNRNYQNGNSQIDIDGLHNSYTQQQFNKFKSDNYNNNNGEIYSNGYQNIIGRSNSLRTINKSHKVGLVKTNTNNFINDNNNNYYTANSHNQNNQISGNRIGYNNDKTFQINQYARNYDIEDYDNKKNKNNINELSSQSNSIKNNGQYNLIYKKVGDNLSGQNTKTKYIKTMGTKVEASLKSDTLDRSGNYNSDESVYNRKSGINSINKHNRKNVYNNHRINTIVNNNKKSENIIKTINSYSDEDMDFSGNAIVNKMTGHSTNMKLNNRNVYTNTNKRDLNVQKINENEIDQTNYKYSKNTNMNKRIDFKTHETNYEDKNMQKIYSKNDENRENINTLDYNNEYDVEIIDDEVSMYEYKNTYHKFKFDSGLNVVGIIGEVLSQLDYQRYKLIDDNIYPIDCSPNIIDGEEFDFIVVGGGNTGCVLANKLSENYHWKVLLIEAGGDALPITQIPGLWDRTLNSVTDWQYNIEPESTTGFGIGGNMKLHKGQALGGSSTTCPQLYVRGSKKIYNSLVEKGLTNWSYNITETYFKKMEKIRSVTITEKNNTIYGKCGPLPVSKLRKTETSTLENVISSGFEHIGYKNGDINDNDIEEGFVSMQGIIKNGRAINTAKAYLSPIFRRENLKVMKYTQVTKVIINKIKMVATGVEVQTKFGQTLTLKSRLEVLLCAGAVGSPKILLASGIGPEKHLSEMEVPVIKNLPVGKNFLISPVFTGFVISYDKPIVFNQTNEEIAFKYLAGNSGSLSIPNGMNFGAFLNTGGSGSTNSKVEVHQFYLPKNSPSKLCQLKSMFGFSDNLLSVYAKLNNERAISIFTIALIDTKSTGKVLLRSTNPLDNPIVVGNMLSDKDDVKSLLEAIKLLSKIENSDSMKLVNATLEGIDIDGCVKYDEKTDEHWECLLKYMISTTSSTAGSCRMGLETDPDAVVDSELNVIGISNLRVIGRTVMPKIISAYSHTPCIMIATRAYNFIYNKYNV